MTKVSIGWVVAVGNGLETSAEASLLMSRLALTIRYGKSVYVDSGKKTEVVVGRQTGSRSSVRLGNARQESGWMDGRMDGRW